MTGVGPLQGVRVVEITGEGPGPYAGMLLSDMGCDVVRVVRPADLGKEWLADYRGRQSIAVDLKHPDGLTAVRSLIDQADVLIEGFRPGVMERLGLGPEECLRSNPKLVYARMTGWGQDGPWSGFAGHDINYVAMSGALYPIGPADRPPTPPLFLLGDYAGGGLMCALGVVAALYEARSSGIGQVIDSAIVDGVALFMTRVHSRIARGSWDSERGSNHVDGGAHFYNIYETKDGGYVSVGAIEPKFYAELLDRLGLDPLQLPDQLDRSSWQAMRERFAEIFSSRTRTEWCEVMDGSDACFAPVLTPSEVMEHPHHEARASFDLVADAITPAPAPRFSRTPLRTPTDTPTPGAEGPVLLRELGYSSTDIERLVADGVVSVPIVLEETVDD